MQGVYESMTELKKYKVKYHGKEWIIQCNVIEEKLKEMLQPYCKIEEVKDDIIKIKPGRTKPGKAPVQKNR